MAMEGKTVVLGITGSIAAYKMANVARMLQKKGCDVQVIMTKNATEFITPLTFETLTNNRCMVNMFDRNFEYDVHHIALAKRADVVLIAPASANVIAKLSCGMADDMLTTTVLACTCAKIIAPAMNTNMFRNPIVQTNLDLLKSYGFEVIAPATGLLACQDIGEGKLPDEEILYSYVEREIACEKDLRGKNILVTAGPTCESLDPVRYITNHSSGKMGYALAKAAMLRGANVTLISGKTGIEPSPFVKVVPIWSAKDMYEAVKENYEKNDIIIKSAAVADFRPTYESAEKIKKADGSLSLQLEHTDDILQYVGTHKAAGQFVCGFCMETQDMEENARRKLYGKNLDMIVANNLKDEGAGFNTDTNVVTILTPDDMCRLPRLSKEEVAHEILNKIGESLEEKSE